MTTGKLPVTTAGYQGASLQEVRHIKPFSVVAEVLNHSTQIQWQYVAHENNIWSTSDGVLQENHHNICATVEESKT